MAIWSRRNFFDFVCTDKWDKALHWIGKVLNWAWRPNFLTRLPVILHMKKIVLNVAVNIETVPSTVCQCRPWDSQVTDNKKNNLQVNIIAFLPRNITRVIDSTWTFLRFVFVSLGSQWESYQTSKMERFSKIMPKSIEQRVWFSKKMHDSFLDDYINNIVCTLPPIFT